jgi:hypothetical protein
MQMLLAELQLLNQEVMVSSDAESRHSNMGSFAPEVFD